MSARTWGCDSLLRDHFVEIKGYFSPKTKEKFRSFPFPITIIGKEEIKPYLEYAKIKFGGSKQDT